MTRAVFSSVRFALVRGSASSARVLCSWAFQSTKAVTRIGLAVIVGSWRRESLSSGIERRNSRANQPLPSASSCRPANGPTQRRQNTARHAMRRDARRGWYGWSRRASIHPCLLADAGDGLQELRRQVCSEMVVAAEGRYDGERWCSDASRTASTPFALV